MNTFKDKVVVITGGATGIGFSFAKRFGQEGAIIVISGRRENRLQEAVAELEK
ncbi:SDR family NAD(P)-dependent oxidoreductase [Vibrio sp. EA2]|uniref:SDR family NAD(P)-dependent oxidoreductase n=1 Tax=Vibrio sp. EA2 TaxID=3079860 RepID=UPI00294926F1|nr:SDR family NAD(P)-dependent oxidoreductase [Vibrio sp. EA2]MDV6253793.1 SDR family NAD(P)-dependent oxidoreductase [Vibrio sp. EA2]